MKQESFREGTLLLCIYIQIWLSRSSYNTTANIYIHVDIEQKNSATVIENTLNFSETTQNLQEDREEEMYL